MRGRPEGSWGRELLAFWAARGVLPGDQGRRRLPEVVCLLRRGAALAGASSVYPADVPLIGGRRFWIYRSLLDEAAADCPPAMISATFAALEAEFDGSPAAPIGVCVLLAGARERHRRPEALWSDPPMVYAGYLGDGRQVRVGYFEGASIAAPAGRRA